MAEIDPEKLAVAVGSAVATAISAAQPPKAEIPTPLKWAAGILSAVATASIVGMGIWLVSTVANVQLTVTRMDERSLQQQEMQSLRDNEVQRRLGNLEGSAT